MRVLIHGAVFCTLAFAVASAACRPGAIGVQPHPSGVHGDLSGLWMGTHRDVPGGGIYRSTVLLLDLRSDTSGALGGTLEIRGELAAMDGGQGKTVPCSQTPVAVMQGKGAITAGRMTRTGAWFQVTKPELHGPEACGASFDLPPRCELRGLPGGFARVSCGDTIIAMRRVSLAGTWVFDEERADQSGDMVTWRLRFHLRQTGGQLTGRADNIRVHVSGDEQRFRCNGHVRYDRQAQHGLRGQVDGRQVRLDLGEKVQKVGPCQGQLSLPATLTGQWKPLEDRLVLKLGEQEHSLWRRPFGQRVPEEP